jgi:energy-coupling factor transport system ATP-binding protein
MLSVSQLSFTHAGAFQKAVRDISFALEPGQGLLVTGPSGGGKSTLLSLLAGLVPRFLKGSLEGQIIFDGKPPQEPADWAAHVGFMTQNPESQFLAGSVEDELYLSLRCRSWEGAKAAALVEDRLKAFGLKHIADNSVFQLSEGQKQKVILAELTALKPQVLLLDEPSANLDPPALAELAQSLGRLRDEGLSLVVADHRLAWLRQVCQSVLVLNQGQAVYQGGWEALEDEEFRHRLGLRTICRSAFPPIPPVPTGLGNGVAAENLAFGYPNGPLILENLSFRLNYGQVTAVVGPSGRGKTTLARLLCGLEKPLQGRISWGEKNSQLALGQVVLQNADHQLYMSTVLAEISLALSQSGKFLGKSFDKPLTKSWKRPKKKDLELTARAALSAFGLEQLALRHPQSLSGGEKQRLVVAVGLAQPSHLIVLDEPTSGLDGLNLRLMAEQIAKAAQSGAAVMVITHDPELVALTADWLLDLADDSNFCLTERGCSGQPNGGKHG